MNVIGSRQTVKPDHVYRREAPFPFWTVCVHRRGRLTITLGDGNSRMYDETCFNMMAPNTPFVTTCQTGIKEEVWVAFIPSLSMLPLLNWPEEMPGIRCLRDIKKNLWADMYEALDHAIESITSPHVERETLAMNAIERVLLLSQSAIGRKSPLRAHDIRIQQVVDTIRDHPERRWTISELAKIANMSQTNLNRRFAEEIGVPLIHYAERIKMDHAKALLLQTNDSITEIAERMGYANPYHFSTRFHAVTGKSPRNFRKNPAQDVHFT